MRPRGAAVLTEPSRVSSGVPTTTPSSMSSHVRKAIRTAIDLEACDANATPKDRLRDLLEIPRSPPSKPADASSDHQSTPKESPAKPRSPSKLAKLAQAKAGAAATRIPKSVPPTSLMSLPKTHTEYLTPIANGATATTAITTSYHTLHSLSASPSLGSVPLVPMPVPDQKPSKLARKAKKAQYGSPPQPPVLDDESNGSSSPLFLPKPSRSRASPSTFGSLLLHNPLTPPEANGKSNKSPKHGKEETSHVEMYQSCDPQIRSAVDDQSKGSRMKLKSPDMTIHTPFSFDVPSPDDIVLNARRSTSLAQWR